jgi:undecaprenyl-phosphate 4-deoxy-4-formamido-L-arabinose transferase
METSTMSSTPSGGSRATSPGADRFPPAPEVASEHKPRVSVVIPVFNEEPNLPELHRRVRAALESTGKTWELIYVDDGSSDRSLEILTEYSRGDPRVRTVEFNRNYGQHAAVFAGLAASRGDIVVTLDADLQNPPEEIPRLVAAMEEGCDVVGTRRRNRQDPLFRKLGSRIVNRITGGGMSDYGCMLRAYSRPVVDHIGMCREVSSFIPVLANLYARKTVEIEVDHAERAAGTSKYGLRKLIHLQFDLMTGFSTFFLRLMTLFGASVALFAFALAIYIFVMRLVFGSDWAAFGVFTLFAVLFLMVGFLFMCLGILGEYIGRIYTEVRNRPRYVVKAIHGGGGGE